MCELLAMSSRYPARLTSSLNVLASHSQDPSRLRDGWGIAYYEGADISLFRETQAASGSPLLQLLESDGPSTAMAIAHIRHATQGSIKLANTAPFVRELHGRMHVFAHNGNMPGVFQSRRFTPTDFMPMGDTDSERAFCVLLSRIKRRHPLPSNPPLLEQQIEIVAEFAAELREFGLANFIYADGHVLFAHADRRLQANGKIAAPALYRFECPSDQIDAVVHHCETPEGEQRVTLLSSAPLTSTGWHPMREGEIVAVVAGEIVASLFT